MESALSVASTLCIKSSYVNERKMIQLSHANKCIIYNLNKKPFC